MSMHTWGGRGHQSECDLTIQPDGSVAIKMGTQDLGTGNSDRYPRDRRRYSWPNTSADHLAIR